MALPGAVSASGYTQRIGTRHPRIQVPRDPELERAIAQARAFAGPRAPASQVVRDLALRGAASLEADMAASSHAQRFLIDVAEGRSPVDLDGLRDVRDRAWR